MLFKLRLSASEWRFAGASFVAKVGLFWLSELVICQWDQERWVCNVVGKGFTLLINRAMDLLVIPQIRRLRNRETRWMTPQDVSDSEKPQTMSW